MKVGVEEKAERKTLREGRKEREGRGGTEYKGARSTLNNDDEMGDMLSGLFSVKMLLWSELGCSGVMMPERCYSGTAKLALMR